MVRRCQNGFLAEGLWSLDTVPATAYLLDGFPGGIFRVIELVARRVRVMS